MATNAQLAGAAGAAPTIPMVAGALMCHDTVMTWLVQIGSISGKQATQLHQTYPNGPAFYAQVFARATDPQITQANAGNTPAGMICSFYSPGGLAHTMATHAQGSYAGTNNLNVGGGLGYTQMAGATLAWNADGTTVGPNAYTFHYCSVADFELRFAQLSANRHDMVA